MSNLNTLSQSVQKVQTALLAQRLPFEVVELKASTRTAAEAAAALECEIAQIIKSLIFRTQYSKQPVLILASGMNRVHEENIEKLVGEKLVKAEPEFVRAITGFAIGGIPPLAHTHPIQHVFIDQDLLRFEILWAAAGTPNAVFKLNSAHLEKLSKGLIIAI